MTEGSNSTTLVDMSPPSASGDERECAAPELAAAELDAVARKIAHLLCAPLAVSLALDRRGSWPAARVQSRSCATLPRRPICARCLARARAILAASRH